MRRVLVVYFVFLLIASSVPVSAKIQPYVYTPTVPDTAFAVIALYKVGDYGRVLEGCEWLMALRTPFDSWGYKYGEEHEAKYTAMALMALIRGESIALGRYNSTINNAAYWLIYKQNPDGSWEDYTGTALAVIALKEFLRSGYLNTRLIGFKKQVEEAITRGEDYLSTTRPKNDVEKIFGYLALGDVDDLKNMNVTGELIAYRAFALAYLGVSIKELPNEFNTTMAIAMALYATGNEKYHEELIKREHFGFWGVLHYRVLDLLSVSKISGFEELRNTACPYLTKIRPEDDWERVILADYYLSCGMKPTLPENTLTLLPWQIAEVARIKHELGENYSKEVTYLLSINRGGIWRDFYNTEYVIWVLKELGVNYDYNESLQYLAQNLTWMINTTNPKTGNPVYYNIPTYYFAYGVIIFKEFRMSRELNLTLKILEERQYPNGAFPYTQGSVAGITSTARVLWALQTANLTGLEMYHKGAEFLRALLYADIPEPTVNGTTVILKNATFILVKNSHFEGNTTERVCTNGLDGYVVIYPSRSPLAIAAYEVNGFRAMVIGNSGRSYVYYALFALVAALIVLLVWKRR